MYQAADKIIGAQISAEQAEGKIYNDMRLMRDLFLGTVGPAAPGPVTGGASRIPQELRTLVAQGEVNETSANSLDGAPRLSAEVGQLLSFVEKQSPDDADLLTPVANKVEMMDPATLLSSAQLLGELMIHANLALAQQTVRSWKANLRADGGAVEDRSVGAVVGTPTFRMAFDGLIERGCTPSEIRSAILEQQIDLVLTAHPTEAQRRTILMKQKRIVELLGEHDKQAMLTPGELEEVKEQIRTEQLAAWRTSNVRRTKPSAEGEARNGLMVIEETCWNAVPEHYRRFARSAISDPPRSRRYRRSRTHAPRLARARACPCSCARARARAVVLPCLS